jgi:hypothetical protein
MFPNFLTTSLLVFKALISRPPKPYAILEDAIAKGYVIHIELHFVYKFVDVIILRGSQALEAVNAQM